MKMRTPPHPGALMRDNLEDRGLSVVEGVIGLASST